jgi:hypothetical protein
MFTRFDAYDRLLPLLLQSRAPVPRSFSMRSRLAHTDVPKFSWAGSAHAARPEKSCLSVGRTIEHSAFSRRRSGSDVPAPRLRRDGRIGDVPVASRFDAPACRSLCSGSRTVATPRPLFSRIREDLTAVRPGTPSIDEHSSSARIFRFAPRGT